FYFSLYPYIILKQSSYQSNYSFFQLNFIFSRNFIIQFILFSHIYFLYHIFNMEFMQQITNQQALRHFYITFFSLLVFLFESKLTFVNIFALFIYFFIKSNLFYPPVYFSKPRQRQKLPLFFQKQIYFNPKAYL
ncbi:hypothetical protein IMG5_186400, partial [Ichthyophthirius multifiliis]